MLALQAALGGGDELECAVAHVLIEPVFIGVVGVVPRAVHHVKHPSIACVLRFRQPENVVGLGGVVVGQIALHHIADDDVVQPVLVVVQHVGSGADLIGGDARLLGDGSEVEFACLRQLVAQQNAFAKAYAQQQVLVAVVVKIQPCGRSNQPVGFRLPAVGIQLRQGEFFKLEIAFVDV